jgi:integrase
MLSQMGVWNAAGQMKDDRCDIVRLMILTAQRRTEVAGLGRAELSADWATWTLPGRRAKNKETNVVQLSGAAQAILRGVAKTNDRWVFPNSAGTGHKTDGQFRRQGGDGTSYQVFAIGSFTI